MRKSGRMISTRLVAAFALLVIFVSPSVMAVENGGIGGRPANPRNDNSRSQSIFVYELKPGQTIGDAVQLFNNTEQDKNISVYPVDSIISSGGAFACAQAADKIKDVGGWIKLETGEVSLKAGDNTKIGFTLSVPNNIEPGEHNGCIAIQELKSPAETGDNGIALSFRSAIRVAITVPGKIVKALTIKSVDIRSQGEVIIATLRLKNSGNVSLDAKIKAQMQNLIGAAGQKIEGTYPTMPNNITELNFEFKRTFWGGWKKVDVQASYNPDTKQSLGEGQETKTESYTSGLFFMVPQPTAIVIYLVIITLLGLLAYYLWRRYWQLPNLAKTYKAYKIQKGDEIYTIAKQSNVDWKHLASVNKLKAPYVLKTDATILIPKDSKLLKRHSNDTAVVHKNHQPVSKKLVNDISSKSSKHSPSQKKGE